LLQRGFFFFSGYLKGYLSFLARPSERPLGGFPELPLGLPSVDLLERVSRGGLLGATEFVPLEVVGGGVLCLSVRRISLGEGPLGVSILGAVILGVWILFVDDPMLGIPVLGVPENGTELLILPGLLLTGGFV
jgi:hypothetical protein